MGDACPLCGTGDGVAHREKLLICWLKRSLVASDARLVRRPRLFFDFFCGCCCCCCGGCGCGWGCCSCSFWLVLAGWCAGDDEHIDTDDESSVWWYSSSVMPSKTHDLAYTCTVVSIVGFRWWDSDFCIQMENREIFVIIWKKVDFKSNLFLKLPLEWHILNQPLDHYPNIDRVDSCDCIYFSCAQFDFYWANRMLFEIQRTQLQWKLER